MHLFAKRKSRIVCGVNDTTGADAAASALEIDPRIAVRPTTLADGRELIYFDDADTTLAAERAVDARTLDPRPATADDAAGRAHRRMDLDRRRPPEPRRSCRRRDRDPLAPQTPEQPVRDPARLRRRGLREPVARRSGRRSREPATPGALDDAREVGLGRTRARWAAARWCASAPSTRARSAR